MVQVLPKFLTWNATIRFKVGIGSKWDSKEDEENFKFKKQNFVMPGNYDREAREWFQDLQITPEGAQVWTYIDEELHQKDDKSDHGSVERWTYDQTITWVRVVIVPGTNQIKLTGRGWTKLDYKIDPSIVTKTWIGGFICKAEWSITFTLQEVSDGGLEIGIDYQTPVVTWPWRLSSPDNLPNNEKTMQEGYDNAGTNFEWCVNEIRNSLQGQERFTLPSEGTYFFKNPIFDHNANLLCELEFNGNLSATEVNTGAPVRTPTGEAKFSPMPVVKSDSQSRDDNK